MAKKNWRDSGPEKPSPATPRTGWTATSKSTTRPGMGSTGKVLILLATAAMLGGLIALFRPLLIPETKTPIRFCDAYPSSDGERILSTNAFSSETQKRLAKDTHRDLDIQPANLRAISDVTIDARQKVAFFYLYADLFVAADRQPYLLSHDERAGQSWDGNAVQPTANTELRKFLEDVCRLEIGDCPRIVVMDCGRLDAPAFTPVHPEATCESVRLVLKILREANVPNVDKLWVLLATDDYQLGWTSPELNGSVFGYFFSAGLRGLADANDDGSVTLAELSLYVQDSVARWVENYRDSVQTPRLLTGGDREIAETIHLVFPHSAEYERVNGLAVSQTVHDSLWKSAFNLVQPHRRQMATTRLVRLEQLRFCQSKEYPHLLQQVQTLLHESDTTTLLTLPVSSDLWDARFRDETNVAYDPAVINDFVKFLAARETGANLPTTTEPPTGNTGDSEKQESSDSLSGAAGDVAASSADEAATKSVDKMSLGGAIQNLSSPARLAVVWHYLHSQPKGSPFRHQQMEESLDFIRRGDSANPVCDDWIQMQLLDLLNRSLPWDKSDFDPAIPIAAVQCFEASQSIARATLAVRRDQTTNRAASNSANQVWLNWRHVEAKFTALENRRRYALDDAVAGDSDSGLAEFQSLLTEYDALRQQLIELIEARQIATDLLFVLPYLKSFVVRDATYRQPQPSGARDFILPLKQLAELEQMAGAMLDLISGRALTDDDFKQLVQWNQTAFRSADELRETCKRIADETARTQSASQYTFAAISLLSSPLPEWIDGRNEAAVSPTRKKITEQLAQQLEVQQKQFFKNPAAAERRTLAQINEVSNLHRAIVVAQLKTFDAVFSALKPFSTADLKLAGDRNWNEVQASLQNLASIETLKNDSKNGADFAFTDQASLEQEIFRLDSLDRQLRFAGPILGLAETPSEIYQQQIRLHQFAAEYRLARRTFDDFWGAGDVKKMRDRDPPVARQMKMHVKNLEGIAGETQIFRLVGKQYSAYDAGSLKQLAMTLSASCQQFFDDFLRLQALWQFNGSSRPFAERQLIVEESTDIAQLQIGLERIAEVLDRPAFRRTDTTPRTGQRITLERKHYFEPFEIPASVANARAVGEVVYRGHQFFRELAISRKVSPDLRPETFVFQPKFHSNDTAMITVENDVDNEINLVFLIDCSSSMKGDALKKVKEATREIMLELVREKRFHIGLAAFAHRGEFKFDRGEDGKIMMEEGRYRIKGNHHPFKDWEMLVEVPTSVSDEQYVNELCESNLDPLQAKSYTTPLYYSIVQTLPLVNNTDRKNILVVVTDGIDSQYPETQEPQSRFEPKPINGQRVRPTTVDDLSQVYQRYAGKVNVLVLETEPNLNNRMPVGFTSVALGSDTAAEMKTHVLDFVGRYKFSVTPVGQVPTEKEITSMGETVHLKVAPDSKYLLQTHGVPSGESHQEITLSGGEDFKFIHSKSGLNFSRAQLESARDEFLPPHIEDSIRLGQDNYWVGRRQSNQLNNVRIGFANKRGFSQFPGRVWAHIRDAEGREFEMVTTSQEFSEVPTYNFQMPNGFRENKIEMTLYVQPRGAAAQPPADVADEANRSFREITGEDGGEFRGLKYKIDQNEDSQTRFTATITGIDGPIVQDFQLECPVSVPIPESQLLMERRVIFKNVQRIQEIFEFEIPTDKTPTFRLHVQPLERWQAAIAGGPASRKSKTGIDPIFGDEIVIVAIGEIIVKN